MEVLFDDIKKTLDAEHVSLPNAAELVEGDAAGPDTTLRSRTRTDIRSTLLNQQLEVSKEVELALAEMKMSDDASDKRPANAPARSRLPKDLPDSLQTAMDLKNAGLGRSERTRTQESSVVR